MPTAHATPSPTERSTHRLFLKDPFKTRKKLQPIGQRGPSNRRRRKEIPRIPLRQDLLHNHGPQTAAGNTGGRPGHPNHPLPKDDKVVRISRCLQLLANPPPR
uniref:Uncharacterized protein n=1 Tax=Pseudonaja textilis TaxID=8673 RepID=A0A670Z4Q6_PSETE